MAAAKAAHELATRFIHEYAELFPSAGNGWGLREQCAGKLRAYTDDWFKDLRAFVSRYRGDALLRDLPPELQGKTRPASADLAPAWIDVQTLALVVQDLQFDLDTLKVYQSNPLVYFNAATGSMYDYLLKEYAPAAERMADLARYLAAMPAFYQAAATNLKAELMSPELTDTAIEMVSGSLDLLAKPEPELQAMGIALADEQAKQLQAACAAALSATQGFLDFLRKVRPQCSASFRLGATNMAEMLRVREGISVPLAKLVDVCQARLDASVAEFAAVAKKLDPAGSVEQVMSRVHADHPAADKLVPETEKILLEIREWIRKEDFVDIPSDELPSVILTPKPFRPWAFAAMDTPGPLEQVAKEAYYWVTPPEPEWSKKEQEEWLGTLNYGALHDISVHECQPGHHLQLLINNRSDNLASRVYASYHFTEGYALHVEEAVRVAGYRAGDHCYHLSQLSETVLRYVRLIVAIRLHTDPAFTVDQATELFMRHAHLGRKPAESEAKRGTFDPGYMNYAMGKLLIEKLRDDWLQEQPDTPEARAPKRFYAQLLRYGSPSVALLRAAMLKDDASVSTLL